MGELIEGAMQQAAQRGRQSMVNLEVSNELSVQARRYIHGALLPSPCRYEPLLSLHSA
jgi:hypothetical protein